MPEGRIAIYLPSLLGGGAERSMLNLAVGMARQGLPVDLVLAEATGPYLSMVPPEVRLVDLKARRVLRSLPALTSYLRQTRPLGLVSALDHANVVALWARRLAKVPTRVAVCMQNTPSQDARHASSLRGRLLPLAMRLFYPWADGIVGVSQGVVDDFVRLTGIRQRVRVIHNPVVTPELLQRAEEPLEHPWFQPQEPPVLLGVGRLTRQKNFPNLIRAFAEVRKRRPARLVILGEGEERASLEGLVRSLGLEGEVELPGFVQNPYAYMKRAGVFVLSSDWEGLPTVLIEALALGTPVVATDCPSGPREILQGGRWGRLVPVNNPAALAQALEATLAEARPAIPEEAYRPYTQAEVVRRYLELLEGV
ncbi:MAG: glycosyltransferase [Meiothermus sp.]|uniref:glycosyltransferase n=1 Tax=Meiothermus sp. TaxID=1955249 RepID=UPI0025E120FE|nr:glycosyltransferase [Meiothermus sp.]MCS7194384.1 glycosyltransferase [Meiothermus sp.]MCX7740311.1 glycosyltransferase [Meiothermus sp.]MDW8089865.1 glycosyltransferase [Meiothermus sp.]